MPKIDRIDLFPVAIPLNHPYKSATRRTAHSEDIVVRISANGISGWGAAALRTFPTGETLKSAYKILEELLIPIVEGQDAFEREHILEQMDKIIPFHHSPKSAIDCALHDLLGKILKTPVYNLLGGKVRDEMPAFDILPLESPERTSELVTESKEKGIFAFKVKMNRDIKTSVQRVQSARESAGEDSKIVVDANMSWTPKLAIQVCALIEPFSITMLEQPVPGHDIDGLEFVTKNTRIPICADESLRPDYLGEVLRRRAADIVNIKINREGGLLNCKKVAACIEASGIEGLCGSVIHSALNDVASAHFFASTPNIVFNESGKSPSWHSEDIVEGFKVENGKVKVPSGPGFGIEINKDAIDKFTFKI
jgi:L-alanine-DL-glutamate epimerase-like enolase superfamily enzyme